MTTFIAEIPSPYGLLSVTEKDSAIIAVDWRKVCTLINEIPYGETTTYGAIAEKLGTYGQPVGNACGGNSIPIIIPCHRVLAADGIGGYSGDGGVERKIELLKLEGGFPYLL